MKKLAVFAFLLLHFSSFALGQDNSEAKRLNVLVEQYFEDNLKLYPTYATYLGDDRYDNLLENSISQEHINKEKAVYKKYAEMLGKIDRNKLTGQDRLSYDVFKWNMEIGIEGYDFESELMPVNQFFDLSIDFPLLGSGTGYHQFKTVKNYDDFLGRINGYETWTNTAIANMRQGIKRGLIQPRILMERKLPQLEEMLVKDIKESLFYQPIKNLPAEFSSKDKERLTKEYEKAISEKIIPSYKKLYDFIKNEYLPHTLKADGISALPGGKARYAYLVKNYTTTNKTPDEIFQIGISEVKRIKAEMEKVKAEVGFRGELKAFFDDTRTNPKLFPFETDEQVLNAYRAIDQKMQPQLAKLFNIKPKTKFEIRQVEKFRAASA
ncbi:MAG TPA: DUF885 domain-containing protein, partial [Segetibacter sp.]